ncbi:hypothetical protein BRI6_0754 [plant metagenome]|uniref:Uncharacterized protein n=1 Tax=plant metagenome TaxID=1297885 RepID=A0A484TR10_9ZZZZ
MADQTPALTPRPFSGAILHFEDEHVAIWEEIFPPGIPTAPHRHLRDYIAVSLTDVDLRIEPLPGEAPESATSIVGESLAHPLELRRSSRRGRVAHVAVTPQGAGHIAVNVADHEARMLIIEIKGSGAEKPAAARQQGNTP